MRQILTIGTALLAVSPQSVSWMTFSPGLAAVTWAAGVIPHVNAHPLPLLPAAVPNNPYVRRAYYTSKGRPIFNEVGNIDNEKHLSEVHARDLSTGAPGISPPSRSQDHSSAARRPDSSNKVDPALGFRHVIKLANMKQQPGLGAVKRERTWRHRLVRRFYDSMRSAQFKRSHIYGTRFTSDTETSAEDKQIKACFEDKIRLNRTLLSNIGGTIDSCKQELNISQTSFHDPDAPPTNSKTWSWSGPATYMPSWWKKPPPPDQISRAGRPDEHESNAKPPFMRRDTPPDCPPCPVIDMPGAAGRKLQLLPARLALPGKRPNPQCACLYPRALDAIHPVAEANLEHQNQTQQRSDQPKTKPKISGKQKLRKRNNNESMENPKYKPKDWHWLWGPFHQLQFPDWWIWYEGDQAMPRHPTWSPIRDEDAHDARTEPRYVDTLPNATNTWTSEPETRYPARSNYKQLLRHKSDDLAAKMPDNDFVTNQKEVKDRRKKHKAAKERSNRLGWTKAKQLPGLVGFQKRNASPSGLNRYGPNVAFQSVISTGAQEGAGSGVRSEDDPLMESSEHGFELVETFKPGSITPQRRRDLAKRELKHKMKSGMESLKHDVKDNWGDAGGHVKNLIADVQDGKIKDQWEAFNGHHPPEHHLHWWEKLNGGESWINWNQGPWMAENNKEWWMPGDNIYIDFSGQPKPWPEIDKEKDWRNWFDWGPNAPMWIKESECLRGYKGPEALCFL